MEGPQIVAQTLSRPGRPDRFGNTWQYHSRSDRHSKVACWAVMFELLEHSATLRRHVQTGQVIFGVNQEIKDFRTGRSKNLDLVIATPGGDVNPRPTTMSDLAVRWGVRLTPNQQQRLVSLPQIIEGPTGMVAVALEAKACMTAHMKARPRLFDELNSSHATVHAHSDGTLAAGFVMVNQSDTFWSTDLNKHDLALVAPVVSRHVQPHWAQKVVEKLEDLPRRTGRGQEGFDALGIVMVDMVNDGSPVRVVQGPPGPGPTDVFHYDQMLHRLAHLYDTSYSSL